jgi:organic radical activating enzyme
MKAGKASWYCDSETVWRTGKDYTNEELVEVLHRSGELEHILEGTTHMIWTGGEPTLSRNAQGIHEFLDYMDHQFNGHNLYNEIETNGTNDNEELFSRMQQVNCSPKLANSGMTYDQRVNAYAINSIVNHKNGNFKFVVSNEMDVDEVRQAFVWPFHIPRTQVYLMPGVDSLKDLSERTRFVYDMAKKYNYRATTRGQVLAWDRTTGV